MGALQAVARVWRGAVPQTAVVTPWTGRARGRAATGILAPSGTVRWRRGVAVTLLVLLVLLPQRRLVADASETRTGPQESVVDLDAPSRDAPPRDPRPACRSGGQSREHRGHEPRSRRDNDGRPSRRHAGSGVGGIVCAPPVLHGLPQCGSGAREHTHRARREPRAGPVHPEGSVGRLDGRAARVASPSGWGGRSSTTRASGSSMRSSMQCAWRITGRHSPWTAR